MKNFFALIIRDRLGQADFEIENRLLLEHEITKTYFVNLSFTENKASIEKSYIYTLLHSLKSLLKQNKIQLDSKIFITSISIIEDSIAKLPLDKSLPNGYIYLVNSYNNDFVFQLDQMLSDTATIIELCNHIHEGKLEKSIFAYRIESLTPTIQWSLNHLLWKKVLLWKPGKRLLQKVRNRILFYLHRPIKLKRNYSMNRPTKLIVKLGSRFTKYSQLKSETCMICSKPLIDSIRFLDKDDFNR